MAAERERDPLRRENEELRRQLAEANDALRAIQAGEVDAVVVHGGGTTRLYTLESAYEPYRAFVERMLQGAASLSPDGLILYSNPRFAQILGVPAERLLGTSIYQVIDEVHWEVLQGLLEATPDQPQEGEMVIGAGNGRQVHALFSVTAMPDGMRCAVVTDVTDRVRRQALEASEEALRDSDRRKDQFIAVLSHELRNPIAPIRYALPVLRAQTVDEAGGRAIEVIDRQVDHLTRLVDDLLDVSRITRGRIELRKEHLTVASAVAAGAEAASPAIVAACHRLAMVVPEEPIWLHADAARISQVVTNLLTNSAKYTPRGGDITVSVERDREHAIIRVRDNGIGIPPEAMATIFDMFTQVDGPRRAQGGLGIGLALVSQFVEMHGGTVEASSAGRGQGAVFIVRLPVATDGRPAEAAPRVQAATGGVSLRVLIVDDNADLVDMLAMSVERAGHDVRKALDGPSAVSAALSYRPDVVFLDLGLPVMSGLEVAKELKGHPETAKARLIALTGWGQAEDRRLTREAGFEHHLTKPTEPRVLQQLLTRIASRGHS